MAGTTAVALGALVVAIATWIGYLATVPSGRVARVPFVALPLMIISTFVAGAAVQLDRQQGNVEIAAIIAASLAFVLAGLFVFLYSVRKTPLGKIAVAVGDTLPPFVAKKMSGERFDSSELAGRWVLLKFYRGSW